MPYFSAMEIAALGLVGAGLIIFYFGYKGRNSSSMPKAFKYGWLAGLAMIGLGMFAFAWEVMSPLTPEKFVQIVRSQVALPAQVDAITQWDAVEASGQRVRYLFSVRKPPRDRDEFMNVMRRQITSSVCEDKLYRAAIKEHIAVEFIYKFGDESYPVISLSPGECAG